MFNYLHKIIKDLENQQKLKALEIHSKKMNNKKVFNINKM